MAMLSLTLELTRIPLALAPDNKLLLRYVPLAQVKRREGARLPL